MGTRPEAIKLWPLIDEVSRRTDCSLCTLLTGQHSSLLDGVVRQLGLPITRHLNVMTHDQTLEELAARLIVEVAGALPSLDPDCVVVQGDTTTAFIGALAAFYARIPVAHVEAGLRTGDPLRPFPEEMHRRMLAALAALHFAPTPAARDALRAEGVPPERIWVTGNTGIDALRMMRTRCRTLPLDPRLGEVLATEGRIVAVTLHRRENQPLLRRIAAAIRKIVDHHGDVSVVLPVHPSPAVRAAILPELGDLPRCHLLDPLDYASFVRLLERCTVVVTDSGGVQEEAPYLGKPVVVVRRSTERPEGVDAGAATVVGDAPEQIVAVVDRLLDEARSRGAAPHGGAVSSAASAGVCPYGDGYAAERIVDVLVGWVTPRRCAAEASASVEAVGAIG